MEDGGVQRRVWVFMENIAFLHDIDGRVEVSKNSKIQHGAPH